MKVRGSIQVDITTSKGKKIKASPKSLPKTLRDVYIDQVSEYAAKHTTKKLTMAQKKLLAEKRGGITAKKTNAKMTVSKRPGKFNPRAAKESKEIKFDYITPTVAQAYLVVAKLYFLIVCTTPFDEPYNYTAYVDRKYTKADKHDRRKFKSVSAVIRKHVPDDEALRDTWCINLATEGAKSSDFLSTEDFNVNWENERGPGYKTIAKKLMDFYKKEPFTTFHIWNSYQSKDGFNKFMALEYGQYTAKNTPERHVGDKVHREHGLVGGYSIQAPQGFVRLAWQEVEDANQFAAEATEIAKQTAKANGTKAKKVTFKAQDIKSNTTFNLEVNSDADRLRREEVTDAVNDLLKQGIARENITRRDIARAIGEKRTKVPVTLGEIKKAAKAKTKEIKKQAAEDSKVVTKVIRQAVSRQEQNRRYWEKNRDRINEQRREKYNQLNGTVTAGGQNVFSGVLTLGDDFKFTAGEKVKLGQQEKDWLKNKTEDQDIKVFIGDNDYFVKYENGKVLFKLDNPLLKGKVSGDWKDLYEVLEDEAPKQTLPSRGTYDYKNLLRKVLQNIDIIG